MIRSIECGCCGHVGSTFDIHKVMKVDGEGHLDDDMFVDIVHTGCAPAHIKSTIFCQMCNEVLGHLYDKQFHPDNDSKLR